MNRFDFDAVTQYVRFWDEKGTKTLRYYVPLKFHGSEAVDSDGCNKNCNQIMFNYLHGYQHPQKEVLSQDLVSYLEGDTLKLVELIFFLESIYAPQIEKGQAHEVSPRTSVVQG